MRRVARILERLQGQIVAAIRRHPRLTVFVSLAVILAAVVAGILFLSQRAETPRPTVEVYHAKLLQHVESPGEDAWRQPAAVAVLDGQVFLLDTGNDRILALNSDGDAERVLDGRLDGRLALEGAMAIASDGQFLYVANSGARQILVVTPAGEVTKAIELEKVAESDVGRPRPISIAVSPQGELLVTDADNNRLLRYDGDGRLLQVMGEGRRGAGTGGFNTPAGVALDGLGNAYVVDMLNGRVVQLSPDGTFLRQLGELGDSGGTFSRPKDVALDADGNIYVSDGLLAAVEVFSPEGRYLGFIGREEPSDAKSVSFFQAPAGLKIVDDRLYVVDRFAGLFIFRIH
jgi:DNA-binding beta-propeller fold protein YncE